RVAVIKLGGIEPVTSATDHLLRGLHTHNRRQYTANKSAPFLVQVLQARTFLGIDAGGRRERVFIRRGLGQEFKAAVLETIVVKPGDRSTNQQNEEEEFE